MTTQTPRTDAALSAVIDEFGELGPEHRALVELAREIEVEAAKYREALELVRQWGEWWPEEPPPDGWPHRENDPGTALSVADIVYRALK